MNFTSYVGKVFVVESSKAIIRDEKLVEQRYKSGEELPPGKNVGDVKTIPQRTEVRVLDVKAVPTGTPMYSLRQTILGNFSAGLR